MAEKRETFEEFKQTFPGQIFRIGGEPEQPRPLCPHSLSGRSMWIDFDHGRKKMCVRCALVDVNPEYRLKRWEIFLFKVAVKFLVSRGYFDYAPEMRRRFFL